MIRIELDQLPMNSRRFTCVQRFAGNDLGSDATSVDHPFQALANSLPDVVVIQFPKLWLGGEYEIHDRKCGGLAAGVSQCAIDQTSQLPECQKRFGSMWSDGSDRGNRLRFNLDLVHSKHVIDTPQTYADLFDAALDVFKLLK